MPKGLKVTFALAVALMAFASISHWSWEQTIAEYEALEPEPLRPTQVNWARVRQEPIADWIHAEGTARAVRKVHLAFEVEGRVTEIMQLPGGDPIREGTRVQGPVKDLKGQLIARLDGKDYAEELSIARTDKVRAEHAVEIAGARLQQTESSGRLAQARLERIQQLRAKGVTPEQEHDEALSEVDLARAAVASASAELAAARATVEAAADAVARASRNFERTRIHAPWSGRVARLNIRERDYVGPELLDTSSVDAMTATFPVTLIDTSVFEVAVEVPGFESAGLRPGNAALMRRQMISGVGPDRGTASSSGDWITAVVHTVAPILSPHSRTVRVKIRTKGAESALLDGELLQTRILRERKETLVIPVNALIHRDNRAMVFVVDPDSERVGLREVRTGIREDNRIEVLGGLARDALVVTDGRRRLMEGDRVALLAPSAELRSGSQPEREEDVAPSRRNPQDSSGGHGE